MSEHFRSYTSTEIIDHIQAWSQKSLSASPFSWPTDGLPYEVHMAFVDHRNANWTGGTREQFAAFALAWATDYKGKSNQ